MPLRLYNTLTRKLELFVPRDPSRVTFYTCGPTVYDYAHIGNFRSFLAADVLRRWIESPLCELATNPTGKMPVPLSSITGGTPVPPVHKGPRQVVHVMNITDVGHMTDDAEGGEHGEDRMAVAGKRLAEAKKSGKLPAGVALDPTNPYDIARFYETAFKEDSRKLGLKVILDGDKDPTLNPRATENVPGMIAVVEKLVQRGFAYVVGTPGARVVYFDVQKFQPYGTLSGNTLDALRSGAGGRVDEGNQATKKHPADFLLWKEDPSHIMKWDSPWGKGYPGWHIECTVMSMSRLFRAAHSVGAAHGSGRESDPTSSGAPPASGRTEDPRLPSGALKDLIVPNGDPLIDLHSGGEDNIFPHHECEIAQSCCAFNADPAHGTFSTMWFHPRFLLVEGTKMSKSKGNFYTLRDLLDKGIEPAAIRLELIKTHYRSNANFTMQGLKESEQRIRRWRMYAKKLQRRVDDSQLGDAQVGEALKDFTNSLNDDLNIASAIALVERIVASVETFEKLWKEKFQGTDLDTSSYDSEVLRDDLPTRPIEPHAAFEMWRLGKTKNTNQEHWGALHLIDNILGVIFLEAPKSTTSDIGLFIGIAPDAAINAKLEERRAARAAKDFKKSDQIRDELLALGYAIKDVAGGKVEVTRR